MPDLRCALQGPLKESRGTLLLLYARFLCYTNPNDVAWIYAARVDMLLRFIGVLTVNSVRRK